MSTITILFAIHQEDHYVHRIDELPGSDTLFIMRGGALDGHGYVITNQQRAVHATENGLLRITSNSPFVQQLSRSEVFSFRRTHTVSINVYWETNPFFDKAHT